MHIMEELIFAYLTIVFYNTTKNITRDMLSICFLFGMLTIINKLMGW